MHFWLNYQLRLGRTLHRFGYRTLILRKLLPNFVKLLSFPLIPRQLRPDVLVAPLKRRQLIAATWVDRVVITVQILTVRDISSELSFRRLKLL
jgi:hypothetical protein